MSSTYAAGMGDGSSVLVRYCETPGCDAYLGVNYPRAHCALHDGRTQS